MGDRCYMEVYCRRCDVARFEDLGFVDEGDEGEGVRMVDEEANFAHSGHMPTDIPWHGHSSDGADYGAASYACDGQQLHEVPEGHGNTGLVFTWDEKTNGPLEADVQRVRAYIAVLAKASALLLEAEAKTAQEGQ